MVRFVTDFEPPGDDPLMASMLQVVLEPLCLAAVANGFENMFQDMLIQIPEMLVAEVVSVDVVKEEEEHERD